MNPRRRREVSGARLGGLAKPQWVCRGCGAQYPGPTDSCQACGRLDFDRFDSRGEANRWAQLRLLQKAGELSELERQVTIQLLAWDVHAEQPAKGPTTRVDFRYVEKGKRILEDYKGAVITRDARTRLRWLEAMGYTVRIS